MSANVLRRLSLVLALVLLMGLAVVPASAQECTLTTDNGGSDVYTCSTDDTDGLGLDVGSGSDTVNVDAAGDDTITFGGTNGAIYSTGNGTLYLVVFAGDTMETGDYAVLMDGDGNIVARGVVKAGSAGLVVNGDGDITFGEGPGYDPNSNLEADDIAMWVNGSGNIVNYGTVTGEDAGMVVGEFESIEDLLDEPTSTGTVTNYGNTSGGIVGMGLFGNGSVDNYGDASGMVAGMAGIGDVEMTNQMGATTGGGIAGMFGYGSGTMTNNGYVSSGGAGMVFISRVSIDEDTLDDVLNSGGDLEILLPAVGDLLNSIEFEGEVAVNNNGLIEAPVGVLVIGDGTVNNDGIIRNGLVGVGAYGNVDITNDGSIYGTAVGVALVGSIHIDTEFIEELFTNPGVIDSENVLGPLFYIAAALNAVEFEGGGTITNYNNIGFDENNVFDPVAAGIVQLGNGDIINHGGIAAEYVGAALYGNGNIVNTEYVTTNGVGLLFIGDIKFDDALFFDIESAFEMFSDSTFGPVNFGTGTVTNTGYIDANLLGIGAIGNVTITNGWDGDVEGGYANVAAIGPNVTINNSGELYDSQLGILAIGDDVEINNDGTIFYHGTGIVAMGRNVEVNNDGGIYGVDVGIQVSGNFTVNNTSYVEGNITAIAVQGEGTVNNSGGVYGADVGIEASGDVTINLREDSDTFGGYTAVLGDDGNQTVNIDGNVYSNNIIPSVVDLEGGRDRVNLRDDAHVDGDIDMGEGDDTVQIESGARAHGLIDGGEGGETEGDKLIVGDENMCGEDEGTAERMGDVARLVNGINLDSDSFNFDGEDYSIENFERGSSGVRSHRCYQFIEDGRINAYDMGATVAGYCNVAEGLNVWAIDEEGNGQVEFSVGAEQMRTALEQAVNGGANVQIAAGGRGTSLWALSSNQYQMMRNDGYVYIFEPGRCGPGGEIVVP